MQFLENFRNQLSFFTAMFSVARKRTNRNATIPSDDYRRKCK